MTKIINNEKFFTIYFHMNLHFDLLSIRNLEF